MVVRSAQESGCVEVEPSDPLQWGVIRIDRVVELHASERIARREAAREGGTVVYRLRSAPHADWRIAA
jgi:hypothetical protein